MNLRDGKILPQPVFKTRGVQKVEKAAEVVELEVVSEMSGARQPKTFTGKEDVKLWFASMELYLEAAGVVSDKKLVVAATYLEGSALMWYSSLETKPYSLSELKKGLTSRFSPIDGERQARARLRTLVQTDSVMEYVDLFEEICSQVPSLSPAEKRDRFFGGLRPYFQQKFMEAPYNDSLAEIQSRLACLIEVGPSSRASFNALEEEAEILNALSGRSYPKGPSQQDLELLRKIRKLKLCFGCLKPGHRKNNCPEKQGK